MGEGQGDLERSRNLSKGLWEGRKAAGGVGGVGSYTEKSCWQM